MQSGLLLLDKPAGMTSQRAVSTVKRLLGADKAGHTGTLDPMATGVLPILIGRGVKAAEYLSEGNKHYLAEMKLGVETDTEDTTGTVLRVCTDLPGEAEVLAAVAEKHGDSTQIPPMYSAIKIGGRKLVDLARQGVTVEREPRPVTVYAISARRLSEDTYALDVVCTKGTYIRTLCADIGRALGCGAAMSALRRAEAAGFTLEKCHTVDELENMTPEERAACVLPIENSVMAGWKTCVLSGFHARLIRNGCAVKTTKLPGCPVLAPDELCKLYRGETFFGVGATVTDEDGDPALKMVKSLGE